MAGVREALGFAGETSRRGLHLKDGYIRGAETRRGTVSRRGAEAQGGRILADVAPPVVAPPQKAFAPSRLRAKPFQPQAEFARSREGAKGSGGATVGPLPHVPRQPGPDRPRRGASAERNAAPEADGLSDEAGLPVDASQKIRHGHPHWSRRRTRCHERQPLETLPGPLMEG